jgi:hypothetical protein
LRSLLEHDAARHLIMQRAHCPIEPAQDFCPLQRILGRQRMLGIAAFQVIDDRPKPLGAATIKLDKNRQMCARIVGRQGVAGQTLFTHHQARKSRCRRKGQMNQFAHLRAI